jgi:hypothetical protein
MKSKRKARKTAPINRNLDIATLGLSKRAIEGIRLCNNRRSGSKQLKTLKDLGRLGTEALLVLKGFGLKTVDKLEAKAKMLKIRWKYSKIERVHFKSLLVGVDLSNPDSGVAAVGDSTDVPDLPPWTEGDMDPIPFPPPPAVAVS